MFSDLQNALKRPPDGILRLDGSTLSDSIASLFADFLPDGRFEAKVEEPKNVTFNDGRAEVAAVKVEGTLLGEFLGVAGLKVQAWFFLTSGDHAEVAMTVGELPDLTRSFPGLRDAAAFSNCAFALDSRRLNPLGADFDHLFSAAKDARKGLSLSDATLNVSSVDKTVADYGISRDPLHVSGPVELQGDSPRMWLTTARDVSLPDLLPNAHLSLGYQYLTAPIKGSQKTKGRLSYKLLVGSGLDALTIPLAITFEPNMLTDKIIVESDWKAVSSPLSLTALTRLLPTEVSNSLNLLLPQKSDTIPDIPSALDKLKLAKLVFEIENNPVSLSGVSARVELNLDWTIVKGKSGRDLVKFGNLAMEINLAHCGDEWLVSPYLYGTLTLSGGNLSGVVDLSAGSFFCTLDDDPEDGPKNQVDLKQLITETLGLSKETFPFENFALSRFEIWGDISGATYSIDIGTTFSWSLPCKVGKNSLTIRNLFLKLEYDGSLKPALGGSLELFGMTLGCLATYGQEDGWTFAITVLDLSLTELLASTLGDQDKAKQLPEVTFPELELKVTPQTGAFSFHGVAEIHWNNPFGADGEFACNVDLELERVGTAQPISCNIDINGTGKLRMNGGELEASIGLKATTTANAPLQLEVNGSLSVPIDKDKGTILSFGLRFETSADKKQITAKWPANNEPNKLPVDFKALATQFGMDMTQVPDALVPTVTSVSFKYDFTESQFLLAATTTTTKLVFLISPKSKQDETRIYALIFKVEARVMLSGLPMVGASLASFGDLGVDGFLAAATSDELGAKEIKLFNELIKATGDLPTLPLPADEGKNLPKGVVIELNVLAGGAPRSLMFYLSPPVKPRSPGPLLEGNLGDARSGRLEATREPPRTGEAWLDVERSFGPVNIKRIGAAYDNGNIVLLLDAGFVVSALTLELLGLSIGFPIKDFAVSKIRPGLHGMSLAYKSGPITISGGFVNVEPAPAGLNYQYNGELLIQAEGFGLSAIGSFAEFNTQGREKSLFLFGVLNATLGGPAFFVITGIAAGFGYNRSLTIPTLDALPGFPLIAAATGTSTDLAKAQENQDAVGALKMMDQYVYPALGESWLAVGVRFTSFKILDSFALLTVSFGNRFEIALLGLSSLTMPPLAPPDAAVGFAQLAIIAWYAPDEGVLKVAAQLTPGSYILSKKCHLTGGFALYTWFRDELDKSGALVKNGFRAGDFVVSLGGYNQNFKTPSYYPIVPRVGANWQINSLTIKGGFYFALTPVAVMAGGALDANFESGRFKAWFIARIDFLLYWEPFYYLASASLSLGASYTLGSGATAWTITVHVGVALTLQGPPFGGTAVVDLYVFSVTIPFGSSAPSPHPLKWDEFKQRYLVPDEDQAPANRVALGVNQLEDDKSQGDSICFSRVSGGLIKEMPKGNPAEIDWIVNPEKFEIVTASKIPCSEAYLEQNVPGRPKDSKPLGGSTISKQFGVTPCGIDNGSLTSTHTIRWNTDDGGPVIWTCPKDKDHILPAVTSRLPRAAWFKDAATDVTKPPSVEMINKERVTDELTTGFRLKPAVAVPDATLPIDVEKLEVKITQKKSPPWAFPTIPATDDWPKHDDPAGRLKVLEKVDTVTRRDRIAAALGRQNIAVAADRDTRYLADAAKRNELLAAPVLCHLGEPKR